MKRLNGLFVILILILGLLSIAYIWKAEEDREILEVEVAEQTEEIDSLKEKISQLDEENEVDSIKGVTTTAIGVVTGIVQFDNLNLVDSIIVCAQDKFTIKEFCTDELIETNDPALFEYTLEIPRGQYFIYATDPQESSKTFYSKFQTCDDGEDCNPKNTNEEGTEILLQIIENEVQSNINIYL